MPDCVQIIRSVEPLIREWFGIVNGGRVPSAFSRTMAICSRSRTRRKPRRSNAAITRARSASTGNLGINRHRNLGHKSVKEWQIILNHRSAKCFERKTDCGCDISDRFRRRLSLPNNRSFKSERVGNETISMLFDDNLELTHPVPPVYPSEVYDDNEAGS